MNIETAEITEDIIVGCEPDEPCNCAIYHALKHIDATSIRVELKTIKMNNKLYQLSDAVTAWQQDLMAQKDSICPVTLEIDHANKIIGIAE